MRATRERNIAEADILYKLEARLNLFEHHGGNHLLCGSELKIFKKCARLLYGKRAKLHNILAVNEHFQGLGAKARAAANLARICAKKVLGS